MHKTKKVDGWSGISILLMAIFLIFLVWPLGNLLKESVYLDGEFSLDAFQEFFGKSYYYGSIFNSLKVGIAVMAVSLVLGIRLRIFTLFTS